MHTRAFIPCRHRLVEDIDVRLDGGLAGLDGLGQVEVQLLNKSPVYVVRSLNYGTAAYNQPVSILVGHVFQLGAIVKF